MKYLFFFVVFCVLAALAGWVTLQLITSGGDIVLPDVTGKDLASAIQHLQETQIYSVIDGEQAHETIPRGSIISQSPSAGETRKRYSTVHLVISSGPEHIDMPDLSGFGVRQARIEASQLGFGSVSEILLHEAAFHEGEVIAHAPGPGEVVLPGSPLRFLVSLGEKPLEFRMPDLIGKSIEESRRILGSHFNPEIVMSQTRMQQPGMVVSQTPKAGEMLTERDSVSLEITPEDSGSDGPDSETFTYRIPEDTVAKQLQIEYILGDERRILRRMAPAPGDTVSVVVSKTGEGRIEVYLDGRKALSEKW